MFDLPPPGAGFTTATDAVAAFATSAPVMEALIWFVLTTSVTRGDPFQFKTAPAAKPEPKTFNVKSGFPGCTLTGVNWSMYGSGFVCSLRAAPASMKAIRIPPKPSLLIGERSHRTDDIVFLMGELISRPEQPHTLRAAAPV